jgi:hypothetical protein
MDRRNLLRAVGVAGFGAAVTGAANADEHASGHGRHSAMPPVENVHLHFCGIHVAKNNPKFQLITEHYCGHIAGGMHQCLLYESAEKNARLLGVEYIIPDEMYRTLPETEQRYWHPHTYEVLGGGLVGPEMKADEEMKFMKFILTTWGKTWHTWPDPKTPVPMGEPLLMWSLMGDDQVDKELVAERDKRLNVSASALRDVRTKEIGFEVPQVPFPQSMEQVGRQWTATGDDKPIRIQP